MTGAAIAQVVPVNGRDDHIVETHLGNGLGQMAGLALVQGQRLAVAHIAERAAAGVLHCTFNTNLGALTSFFYLTQEK